MSQPSAYALYGLVIRSELPLAAPCAAEAGAPDLTVQLGDELPVGAVPPPGEIWAQADFGHGHVVQLTRTPEGWSVFFATAGEFRLTEDLRSSTAHALPGKDAVLPLLMSGSVVSWWLSLRGESILHASAVAAGGEAVAFIGASGKGKSTLATLLCAAGADFITDDVLRLEPRGLAFHCHPGTGEVRLRAGAASLAGHFAPEKAAASVDERLTLELSGASVQPRLKAIAVPQPSREHARLVVERLSPLQASYQLNGYPRVLGWRVAAPLRRQFEFFARLAQTVPVFKLIVPWGPPFDPELAHEIAHALGLDLKNNA